MIADRQREYMRKYEHENAKTAMQKAWQLCVIFMNLLKTEVFPDENYFNAADWAAAARADELVAPHSLERAAQENDFLYVL